MHTRSVIILPGTAWLITSASTFGYVDRGYYYEQLAATLVPATGGDRFPYRPLSSAVEGSIGDKTTADIEPYVLPSVVLVWAKVDFEKSIATAPKLLFFGRPDQKIMFIWNQFERCLV